MDLDRYVIDLRRQLATAAESGGDETRALAERLSASLDAATRLVLLEALSDAATEITRELAPGSVEVRLRGRDPEFAITRGVEPEFAEMPTQAPIVETDDTGTTRTTLRLPDHLKSRVEQAAADDGLSLNTWLVRAIATALEPKSRRSSQRELRGGDTYTGWVR
jgi:hypothetical protein